MNKEVNLKQALLIFIMMLLMVIGCGSIDNTPLSTYTISGTVTGDVLLGVTITLSGGTSTTTDKDGKYSFGGLANNNIYTVTPSRTGYSFSPSSLSVPVGGKDVSGNDFTAQVLSISGTVTGANGVQEGVLISLTGGGTTHTDESGKYTFTGPANGLVNGNTYTVTPSLTGYVFTPSSLPVTVNGANTADFSMTVPYAQTYLTGKWILHSLTTTTSSTGASKWQYRTATVDSSGKVTFSPCLDSAGSAACPAETTWTFDHSSAVIIQSGAPTVNMTMTSNKNFIAGTSGAGTSPSLIIAQKVTGTTYINADVNSQSFVFHQLSAGSNDEWRYGAGVTDGSGVITMTSETGPNDTATTLTGTLSVDVNGGVTMSSIATFNGFLSDDSDDKKTIVGTYTDGSNYKLMIIQITTTQNYTAGYLPAGASVGHLLAGGGPPAPFWNYFPSTVDSGGKITINVNNVTSSNPSAKFADESAQTSITPSGAVTWTDGTTPSHGQLSDDGKFIVAIFTTPMPSSPIYGLFVLTK